MALRTRPSIRVAGPPSDRLHRDRVGRCRDVRRVRGGFVERGRCRAVLSSPLRRSDAVGPTRSASCAAPAGSERPQPSTTISEADVRVGPWQLGISLGRDALFRQYAGSNRQTLEQLAKGRDDLAARLSVASPEPFTPEQIANANTEFVAFVEQGGAAGNSAAACRDAFTSSLRAVQARGVLGLLGNGSADPSRRTCGVRNGDPFIMRCGRTSPRRCGVRCWS